ncbi:carbohydrate sulfotransferase 15-like [Entelurus aequoreus]|uniref:carbohydrate sulfotransferase 15-like n=1 Tax=Entelurus aequoreus TaxID=161455 RepID=UPI002B1E7678|nr:carbohydrate sulfotransferase 15-like [Entelurus aequoreus]XP_061913808.1 carbohydrate sulfotransferase 15-like [Entelurus aequoreus]XP_061913810.1 carbohydrate sulfotransferase 15-like [Entelurus aequoreus]
MALTGWKHGRTTRLDHGCVPHSPPVAGHHGTLLDARPRCTPEHVRLKSSAVNFSRVKTMLSLLGMTLTFLVTASYVLTWDKKGVLSAAYQVKGDNVSSGSAAAAMAALSSEKTSVDMKQLMRMIHPKLEYPPRRAPEEKDIIETDPQLFSVIPRHFLPGIKSPCWYQEFSGGTSDNPYKRNLFAVRSKSFLGVSDQLRSNFRLRRRDGGQFRLRCLPYFYIIGQPKCGTTDLFYRMLLHPQGRFNFMKEPHWWTRKRFGYIRFKYGSQRRFPVEDYLDLFDLSAHNIHAPSSGNPPTERPLQLLTGEASASTMWDNQVWRYLHGDGEETEPPFLVQDFIHTAQPGAKVIVMLREPAERLYSDYLYFNAANKSAEDFHQKVVRSVKLFQSCLLGRSLRFCVYSTSLANSLQVRLNLGLYIVFLLDWLSVFPREQILVLRLEDYATNLEGTLDEVFSFLEAGPLPKEAKAALVQRPSSNTRRAADKNLGPMLPCTRRLLGDFHQPFNHKLASVLQDQAFLWSDS